MRNNFKLKDSRFFFQFKTLFFAFLIVIVSTLQRSNKSVLIHSIYEEIMPYMHRISHFGGLSETKIGERKNKSKYLKDLIKYLLTFSIIKGETTEAKSLPMLDIELPYKEMNIIMKDRKDSIKRGYLNEPSWAKGTITEGTKSIKAKFRLKGDFGQHWFGNKRFSLRVRIQKNKKENDSSILGMKTFSLHKLSARQYPYENIFQELIRDMGFHYIPHKIVKVRVNGNYWGLMDMQEHFSNQLLAKNKMRESLMFTLSNDLRFAYVNEEKDPLKYQEYWFNHPRLFLKLTNNSFEKLNLNQKQQYNYVKSSLKSPNYQNILFSQRHLKEASDLINIWGNLHPISLNNIKFYLNPFTLKLEPLMADQGPFIKNKNGFKDVFSETTHGFLSINYINNPGNKNFKKRVIENLTEFEPQYEISSLIFPNNTKLSMNIPKENYISRNNRFSNEEELADHFGQYKENIKCENKTLSIPNKFPAIHAIYTNSELEIIPLLCGKFKFKELKLCKKEFDINAYLNPKEININQPFKIPINSQLSRDINCPKSIITVKYSFNGENKSTNIRAFDTKTLLNNPLIGQKLTNYIVEKSKGKYLIESGSWIVNHPIKIKGDLTINEGAKLQFGSESFLIVEGKISINGSSTKPVIMTSLEKNQTWKGIHVFNNSREKKLSKLKFLEISNIEALRSGILNLTGGMNFYNTNIEISNLEISNSLAEDALNIINGELNIKNLSIDGTISDGFDCDFCEGNIQNLILKNIGGDGLDISSSKINANISKAINIRDKVVSIGEGSDANVSIASVENSFLAAAVKDASKANISLKDVQTNGPLVMSYVKKDFYEGETFVDISINEIYLNDLKNKFLADKNTEMRVNNKLIKESDIDVISLYEDGPMKK